jgi:PiT family inorganic phosphate transporter
MGGFIGAALANAKGFSDAGVDVINYAKVVPTFLFIFMAPLIGMFIAFFITILIVHLCKRSNPYKAENWFKRLQLVSSAAFSIGHGGNDAQKVMGIIGAAMIYYQSKLGVKMDFNQFVTAYGWVPFTSFLCIGLGTMSGGWKIVKTMGNKITKVTPFEGVAAETAGAITLFFTEGLKFPWKMGGEVVKGIPVSTTHTITGSIIGVGITKRISAVKWGVTGKLLVAWIITIPISAGLGALFYYIMHLCGVNA